MRFKSITLLACSMGLTVMLRGVSSHAISNSPAALAASPSPAVSERLWLALGEEAKTMSDELISPIILFSRIYKFITFQ